MGLAQALQRPLNKMVYSTTFNDSLSTIEDGFWALIPLTMRSAFASTSMLQDYDIVMERMWIYTNTNALTGGSVNTFKIDINDTGGELEGTMTITDATPLGLVASARFNLLITRGQRFSMLWNSNSAGLLGCRALGMQWRAVAAT